MAKGKSRALGEAVIALKYEIKNSSELRKFKNSIQQIKKPAADLDKSLGNIANKNFDQLSNSIRRTSGSVTSLVNRVNTIKQAVQSVQKSDIKVRLNTTHASSATKQLSRDFVQLSRTIRGLMRGCERSIEQVANKMREFGGVIKVKGVATLKTNQFISALDMIVFRSKEAGEQIRRNLNINAGVSGGGSHGPNAGNQHNSSTSSAGESGVGFGKKMMGGFAAFTAGRGLIEEAVNLRDEWVSSMNTLKFITGGIDKAKEAQTALLQVTRETHSSYEGTRDLFVSFQQIADKTKLSLQENVALTKTVQAAAKLGGGGAENNKLAITQLEQAVKKGKMDQQDLHSIEQFSPGITKALADGMGKSVADLREVVHKGLSSEDIIKAFQKVGPEISKLNAEADLTFGNIKEYAHSVFFEIVGDIVQAGDGMKTVYEIILKGLDYVRDAWKSAFGKLTEWLGSAKEAAEYVQMALASLGSGAVIAALVSLGSALAVAFWPVTLAAGAVFALMVAFKQVKAWVDGSGDSLLDRMFGDFGAMQQKFMPFWNAYKQYVQRTVDWLIRIWTPIKGIFYNIFSILKVVVKDVFDGVVNLVSGVGELFGISGEGTPLEKAFNTILSIGDKMKEKFETIINVVQNLTSFLANIFQGDDSEIIRKLTRLGLTIEATITKWLNIAKYEIQKLFDEDNEAKYNAQIKDEQNKNIDQEAVRLGWERGYDVRSANETAEDNIKNNPMVTDIFTEYNKLLKEHLKAEKEINRVKELGVKATDAEYNNAVKLSAEEAKREHRMSDIERISKVNGIADPRHTIAAVRQKMDAQEAKVEEIRRNESMQPKPLKGVALLSKTSSANVTPAYTLGGVKLPSAYDTSEKSQSIKGETNLHYVNQPNIVNNNNVVNNVTVNDANTVGDVLTSATKTAAKSFFNTVEVGTMSAAKGVKFLMSPSEATGK